MAWGPLPTESRHTGQPKDGLSGVRISINMTVQLRPFQREFLKHVDDPAIDICALSLPRGNGKSFLAAHVLARCLTPSDPWFQHGKEMVQCAGSIEQARMVYGFIRAALEPTGEYRWIDSVTRLGVTHKETNTKLRVISSNGKTAMGLVNTGIAVADEPGSWEIAGGQLMWDALTGAQGKPGSRLKIVVIGTLGPAATGAGHWWWDLVHDGSRGSTYVQALQGDRETWDQWQTIRKANPLTAISADFRAKLLEERNAARSDGRLKARYLTYRLNVPTRDEEVQMLSVDDWERCLARPVVERGDKRPVVGVDLGGGRSFSAATAIFPNGRTEAIAVAPGIPSIRELERRDRVPKFTYQRLVDSGRLLIAEGLRVQPPSQLVDAILAEWGKPVRVVCDRFRLSDLEDCKSGIRIEPRISRWSESSEDIRALRKIAKDGPLSVDRDSRLLLTASLATAAVKNDDAGNVRPVKQTSGNTSRDDVAFALMLAAGEWERRNRKPPSSISSGVIR